MREILQDAIRSQRADYIDIRVEETESSFVSFRGPELDNIGTSTTLGGCVRAIAGGGWGVATFNSLADLKASVEAAVSAARLVGGEKVKLAPVEPHVGIVKVKLVTDPRQVPLSEKKRIFEAYNDIIRKRSPKVQLSVVSYRDRFTRKYYANSEGTYVDQENCQMGASLVALGPNREQIYEGLGSVEDFGAFTGKEDVAQSVADRLLDALDAQPVKGGTYTVVIDPVLGGVFAHEAFGHLSESDFIYENPRMQEIMTLGRRFGHRELNIVDGAAEPGNRGSYLYDDEGTPASRTYLIKEGELVGRLHSRETAGIMGERPTGNARAVSYKFPPIVRMTNTFIEPGKVTFEEMISDIELGVYAIRAYGGTTAMEMFTFSAGEAFMIRNGKIAERVSNVVLSGNVFETLKNIDAIGNDFHMDNTGLGGCGKGEQFPLPTGTGSPHLRIRNVVVGGAS